MFYNARLVISLLNNSTTVNVYIHITYVHNITENAHVACASLDWDHTFFIIRALIAISNILDQNSKQFAKVRIQDQNALRIS